MEGDLEVTFKKASEVIRTAEGLSNEEKTFLYSHFKQATDGDNTRDKPDDAAAVVGWEAWKALGGVSKADAA